MTTDKQNSLKNAARHFRSLGISARVVDGKVVFRGAKRRPMRQQTFAERAIELLNSAQKGTAIGALADAMRATSQATSTPQSRRPSPDALARIGAAVDELNRQLARRPATVRVFFTAKPVRLFLSPEIAEPGLHAVLQIINASDSGAFGRLKACEHCQRFFSARRDVDRFCPGTSCRKNWHRNTPAGKAQNREHQRRYREYWSRRS